MCLNSPSHGLALKKRVCESFFAKRLQNYSFYLEYANILGEIIKNNSFILKKVENIPRFLAHII